MIGAIFGKNGGSTCSSTANTSSCPAKAISISSWVELAGGTVAPGVLVPEAGGNLEVLVKAGGHQQLLELLGGLGQGVELARMLAGGHQVVPGALGEEAVRMGVVISRKPWSSMARRRAETTWLRSTIFLFTWGLRRSR